MKSYLGDGVYVEVEIGCVVLTTENGIETTNTIVLEPEVLKELFDFLQRISRASNLGLT